MAKYPEKQALDAATDYVADNLKSTHISLQNAVEALNDNLTDMALQMRKSANSALKSPMAKRAQMHPFATAGLAMLAGIVLARLTRR